MGKVAFIQIGKNGVSDNFLESLKSHFKTHSSVRISVLKSARAEGKIGKEEVKKYTDKILQNLGGNYKSNTIGFTIIIKKFKKKLSK